MELTILLCFSSTYSGSAATSHFTCRPEVLRASQAVCEPRRVIFLLDVTRQERFRVTGLEGEGAARHTQDRRSPGPVFLTLQARSESMRLHVPTHHLLGFLPGLVSCSPASSALSIHAAQAGTKAAGGELRGRRRPAGGAADWRGGSAAAREAGRLAGNRK